MNADNVSAQKNDLVEAVVTDVWRESPTVKGFSLIISDAEFSFKAGQWVDTFIDGLDKIAGFTIVTSPSEFNDTKTFSLGVKYSEEAPALWFHDKCTVGSKLKVRSGGPFFYPLNEAKNVLLIGGGVGVNPLMSMMAEFSHQNSNCSSGKLKLLYSTKSPTELLYREKISRLLSANIGVQFFCTSESSQDTSIINNRIDRSYLSQCIKELGKDNLAIYLCGPVGMMTHILELLKLEGISNNVYYENWWL